MTRFGAIELLIVLFLDNAGLILGFCFFCFVHFIHFFVCFCFCPTVCASFVPFSPRQTTKDYLAVTRRNLELVDQLDKSRGNELRLAKALESLTQKYAELNSVPILSVWKKSEANRGEFPAARIRFFFLP